MAMGEFLARIRMVIDGKEKVISALKETEAATKKLSDIKVMPKIDSSATATAREISSTMTQIAPVAEKATKKMSDFEKAIRRAAIVAPVWMLLRNAMMAVFNLISAQGKFLVDLESAMARIRIVGKGSAEEFKNLEGALVALSYAYGIASSEAAEAAKIFAQQGRNAQETIALTRAAMIGSQVLGTDIKTTVNNMTAAVEGFQIPVQRSMEIVDRWISVEKEFAVTAQDLADATKVTGATANQLGVSISEFLGDITAIIEVTRKSGSEAARGLSFIYTRLLTNARPVIEQIAKIPFYLDESGKASNRFSTEGRSVSDILGDLALKWDYLNRAERLAIAESVGSKRQMTIVNALMQNYNRSLEARVVSLTSAGSAQKAFNELQGTTEFKAKSLQSAWNNLTYAVADTGSWKAMLDVMKDLVIGWTSLVDLSKGAKIVYAQEVSQRTAAIEAQKNELESIEELINLRKKLSEAPQTDKNLERLKKIDEALKPIFDKYPDLEIKLKEGTEEELIESKNKILDALERENIILNVSLSYDTKLATLQQELKKRIDLGATTISLSPGLRKEIVDIENKIKELNEEQNKEISKQITAYERESDIKRITSALDDESLDSSKELTEAEKEKLEIERKLSDFNFQHINDEVAQLQYKYSLVQQQKFYNSEHEKTIELSKLENDIIDAKMKKRKEDIKNIQELVFQYEKTRGREREEAKRKIEILRMSEEQQISRYQMGGADRRLLLEMSNLLSENVKNAMAAYTSNISGLQVGELFSPSAQKPSIKPEYPSQITEITGIKEMPINIYIQKLMGASSDPDEIISEMKKAVNQSLDDPTIRRKIASAALNEEPKR